MDCLRCGRKFDSEGIGNRLCNKCNRLNQSQYSANLASVLGGEEGWRVVVGGIMKMKPHVRKRKKGGE